MRKMFSILNRHALFAVPVLFFVFASIAGWIGVSYGFHNLFRDHPGEFCPGASTTNVLCDAIWAKEWWKLPLRDLLSQLTGRAFFTSTYFQNGAFGTALMGVIWAVFILTFELENPPHRTHPIRRAGSVVWPGVFLLSLAFVVIPVQLAIASSLTDWVFYGLHFKFHLWGLIQTLGGVAFALAVVWVVLRATIAVSMRVRYPQLATASVICAVILALFWFVLPLMPGFAVFLSLATLTLIYGGWLLVPKGAQFGVLAALAALVILGQGTEFKNRFPGLAPYYADGAKRPTIASLDAQGRKSATVDDTLKANLLDPVDVLNPWRDRFQFFDAERKPIFIAVAASGGGYRATYWTALVIDHLSERYTAAPGTPGMADSFQLFTGASGGMVAAAYFVATRSAGIAGSQKPGLVSAIDQDIRAASEGPSTWETAFRNARRDSLTPVVQKWLRNDVPRFFWQGAGGSDRGTELEAQWRSLKEKTFGGLLNCARNGWCPSIIFSPMLIDSGRPLLISNLELSDFAQTDQRGVQFFRLFPDMQDTLSLATAARMSASFPYVAPATELPTDPSDRVVDAGYYDNDGIGLAAAYLHSPKVAKWIKDNASGVILLRVNAFAPQTLNGGNDNACFTAPPTADSWLSRIRARIGRGLRFLSSPIEGAYRARDTASRLANGQHVQGLRQLYGENFFLSAEIAYHGFASESWLLPEAELRDMRNDIERCNSTEFGNIRDFWSMRIQRPVAKNP